MSKTVILKFGGSSLADEIALDRVAGHIAARHRAKERLVIVVSAMGKTTEGLMAQAAQINPAPPPRELDMLLTAGERISMALLAMALAKHGVPAISLTGSQSGILTDNRHNEATIVAIAPQRVEAGLASGRVVIVAGYQGVSADREITTLGRGGSDTTAVALGAALDAASVELCSDVIGIFTADPHLCPQARLLEHIAYTPMQTLGWLGARVLKPQATAFAQRAQIAIKARHHAQQSPATQIGPPHLLPPPVVAVAHVARAAWVVSRHGDSQEQRRLYEDALHRAEALTGVAMLVASAGALIDWTFALPDAHERFVAAQRDDSVLIESATCVSLVGDDLLRTTRKKATHALTVLGIPIWFQWHTGFHLTYVLPSDQAGLKRAVSAFEALTQT